MQTQTIILQFWNLCVESKSADGNGRSLTLKTDKEIKTVGWKNSASVQVFVYIPNQISISFLIQHIFFLLSQHDKYIVAY